MLKHIREAIKQSGADFKEITVQNGSKGHVYLLVRGRRITTSSSPSNHDTVVRRIAKDIRAALQQTTERTSQ